MKWLAIGALALQAPLRLVYLDGARNVSLANTETGTVQVDVKRRAVEARGKRLVLDSKADGCTVTCDTLSAALYDTERKDARGAAIVGIKTMDVGGDVVATWTQPSGSATLGTETITYRVTGAEGQVDATHPIDLKVRQSGAAKIETKDAKGVSMNVDGVAETEAVITGKSTRFTVEAESATPPRRTSLRIGDVEGPVQVHYVRKEFVGGVLVATKRADFSAQHVHFDFRGKEPEIELSGDVTMDASGLNALAHSEARSIIIVFDEALELSRVGFNRHPS